MINWSMHSDTYIVHLKFSAQPVDRFDGMIYIVDGYLYLFSWIHNVMLIWLYDLLQFLLPIFFDNDNIWSH